MYVWFPWNKFNHHSIYSDAYIIMYYHFFYLQIQLKNNFIV